MPAGTGFESTRYLVKWLVLGIAIGIDAIHHRGGRIRAPIPPVKLVASAITIGSGGSGGREGPAAQISAGDRVMIVAAPAPETVLRGFLEGREGRGSPGSAEGQP